MMTVDEFVKLLLAVSASIAVVGISIQIMRLLGTLNSTLQDFRFITHQIAEIIDKLSEDYEKIRTNITQMTSPLKSLNNNVIAPLTEMSLMLGAGVKSIKKHLVGEGK